MTGPERSLDAVVVGGIDYGDADRIVKLLSADEGRSVAMARRARASKKRFAGALETGTLCEVRLRQGRGGMPLLIGVDVEHAPRRARQDLDRIALLAYGCEVCAALAPEHHPAPRLFKLLLVWLDLLEGEEQPTAASRMAMEAKALTFAGLTPALVHCARCQGVLDDPVVWDHDGGGGVHDRCGGGREVASADLARLEALRRTPLADTPGAQEPPGARWVLSDFLRWHLERDLRSRALLEQIERPAGDGSTG